MSELLITIIVVESPAPDVNHATRKYCKAFTFAPTNIQFLMSSTSPYSNSWICGTAYCRRMRNQSERLSTEIEGMGSI
jgi:hypothetical protein